MFTGCFTALVTPFRNGRVDERALRRLIEFQIKNGVAGVVPCGTTGESATLSYEEHNLVVDIAVSVANGRVKVIAGTGSNSTSETIMLTRHAEEAGADAALLITPYYNKPTQAGLIAHYRSVAAETAVPIILYNVPGRTGVNLLPETVARLSEVKGIVGIKEATGNLAQVSDVIEFSRKGFEILSGDDFTTLPLLTLGGCGVISVTSNIAPRDVSDMCGYFFKANLKESRKLHFKLQRLHRAMFVETNPMPVKTALALMGMMEEEFRLPLVKMGRDNRARLKIALKGYGLI
ncbi:MAG: 4-hydroxy-tetrahydrodipicolinate synthase [Deltaproteobacteria bacterium]|nr:4-hydroxy-tetrahydrodipicolinate synthase [Deltaproteobacteria bacterium]